MKLTTEISLNLLALIFNSFLQLFLRAIIWKNQLVKKKFKFDTKFYIDKINKTMVLTIK